MSRTSLLTGMKERARALEADSYALYLACRHPRTPWYAKLFAGVVVAYAASPIDLIPDFIPVLGYVDDLIIVPLGIFLAVKMVPGDVLAECRLKAERRPPGRGRWLMAAVIVAVWAVIAFFIIRALIGAFSGE
jgi:uncharacterized membrane protein YkvA (DUF1232 family)